MVVTNANGAILFEALNERMLKRDEKSFASNTQKSKGYKALSYLSINTQNIHVCTYVQIFTFAYIKISALKCF